LAEYIFVPQHTIFPGGSTTSGCRWQWPNVWLIDSECKAHNSTAAESKNNWYGQRPRITEKSECSVFDKTSKFNHIFFTDHSHEEVESCNQRTKKNNQPHVTLFQNQFGVCDFLKQTLKLSFAHSNFLYNFYEQTKSVGGSVFTHSWLFGGTFSNDEEMKKNALQKQC